MNSTYCQHCWPTKRRSHLIFHLEYYLESIIAIFLKPLNLFKCKNTTPKNTYGRLFIHILSLFKIIRFVAEPDIKKLYNRSLIFFKEAKERGLDIKAMKFLWFYTDEFRLVYNKKIHYYNAIPITIFPDDGIQYHDKFLTKKIVERT